MVRENIKPAFHFKQFNIVQTRAAMKLNTDGVLLGAWTITGDSRNILDIGTGTGILALMMAQKSSAISEITAVEIDKNSCLDAGINFKNSPFFHKIKLIHQSIQNFSENTKKSFDLIISNPPYYTEGTSPNDANRASVKHTINLPHRELLFSVSKLLTDNGSFNLILPFTEGKKFIKSAEEFTLFPENITHVVSVEGRPVERLLIRLCKFKKDTIHDSITIKHSDNLTFTEKYIRLTKEFYMKFP
jgi:tRNA1Val (adenine37-N6)-methyltransferase